MSACVHFGFEMLDMCLVFNRMRSLGSRDCDGIPVVKVA